MDKFSYDNVQYVNNHTPVKLVCNTHNCSFNVTPFSHLKSEDGGCPDCIRFKRFNLFLNKARDKFGDKFTYIPETYVNKLTEIDIICPIHGHFRQSPENHLSSVYACPECAKESTCLTFDQFVERSNLIHNNKYDYSHSKFVDMDTYITIVCPNHGEFIQKPYNHIYGSGCQKCRSSKLEINMRRILTENNIVFDEQKSFDWLRFRYPLRLDFYLPELNVAIECQGTQHYYFTVFSQTISVNDFVKSIKRDITKLLLCLQHGIKIVYTRKKYEPTDIEKVLSLFTDKTAYLKHYDRIIARMKRDGIDTEEVSEIYDELKKCVTSF